MSTLQGQGLSECVNCCISFDVTTPEREIVYQPAGQLEWEAIQLQQVLSQLFNVTLEGQDDVFMCGPCISSLTILYKNYLTFCQLSQPLSLLTIKRNEGQQITSQATPSKKPNGVPTTIKMEMDEIPRDVSHQNDMELEPEMNEENTTLIQTIREGDFVCILCQTPCHNAAAISRHIYWHHVPRGSKKCPIPGCLQKFSSSGFVKYHLDLHVENRPYPCTVEGCSKSFIQAISRQKHELIFHQKVATSPPPGESSPGPTIKVISGSSDDAIQGWFGHAPVVNALEIFGKLPFVPWGNGVDKNFSKYELTNTCSLDNTLMALTALTEWSRPVFNFLMDQSTDTKEAETLLSVTKLVKMGQFHEARVIWWRDLAKRRLTKFINCHGSEDEVSLVPLNVLFKKYRETHLCPKHGAIYEGLESICHFESPTMTTLLPRLQSSVVDPELRCSESKCKREITRTLTLPEEGLPFLIFNVHEETNVENIPARVTILGTEYILFCVSLYQRVKDHFVLVYPWQGHWLLYNGMSAKGAFEEGPPSYDNVSLVWYVKSEHL